MIPNRTAVKRAAVAAMYELAEERIRQYMEAFDEESENWEDADANRIRADILEGTWRFLHPALTDFYISPQRDAFIEQGSEREEAIEELAKRFERRTLAAKTFLDRFDQLVLCRDAKELDLHLKAAYDALRKTLEPSKIISV
jgi:hypothetical protein